ncbi:polysaccharide deacetylase, partial [Salmonella sp. zj-f54]|nr:polysaccharide deacetylase [Salmonella sp. zj-f54]
MRAFIDKMRRRAGRYLDVRPVDIRPARGVLSLSFDDIPASAWT